MGKKARTIFVQIKSCETNNQAELSLLWKYYHIKGLSGVKTDALVSVERNLEVLHDVPPF